MNVGLDENARIASLVGDLDASNGSPLVGLANNELLGHRGISV